MNVKEKERRMWKVENGVEMREGEMQKREEEK